MTFIFVSNSAPITANAATVKKVGVGKSFTYNAKATVKSVKVSKKGIVKATKKGKKVTVKGVKAGATTVTVKTAKKTIKLNVKVGATKIAKKTLKSTMTAGTSQTVSVTATGGKGDTIKFASSNKAVLTVNKASAKASTKGIAKMGVKAVKEGTAKLTVSSKNTGVKKTFSIKVEAAAPAATQAPPVATTPAITTPSATPGVATTPAVTATAPAGTDAAPSQDPNATKDPNETQDPNATKDPNATQNPDATKDPNATQNPDATKDPNATTNPDATEVPSVSTNPAVTASPSAVEFTAKQTGDKKITVTNPTAMTKNDIVVKRGNSTVTIDKVDIDEAGTTAVITLAGSIVATEYTVTIGEASKTFTGEASTVKSIEVLSDKVALNDQIGKAKTGTANYAVYNQFGENVTAKTSLVVNSSAKASLNPTEGTITFTWEEAPRLNDYVSVVLMYQNGGISTNKMLTVATQAAPAEVEIKGVYNVDGNKLAATNINKHEFCYLFRVKDQYGNYMTSSQVHLKENLYVNYSAGMTNVKLADNIRTITIDGVNYLGLDITPNEAGTSVTDGTVTVMIMPGGSGKTVTDEIVIGKGNSVSSLTISVPGAVPKNGSLYLEYVALDENGNDVTDYRVLKEVKTGDSRFNWIKENGKVVLKYTDNGKAAAGSSVSAVFTLPNYTTKLVTVNIADEVHAASVSGLDSSVAKAARKGDKVTIPVTKINLQDQYGNTYDNKNLWDGYTALAGDEIAIMVVDEDDNNKTFTTTEGTAVYVDANGDKHENAYILGRYASSENAAAGTANEFTFTGSNTTGTENETFKLVQYNKDANKTGAWVDYQTSSYTGATTNNTQVGAFTTTLTNTENKRFVSYDVNTIDSLYSDASAAEPTYTTPANYEQKVTVYGVLSNGEKVELKVGDDFKVNDGDYVTANNNVIKANGASLKDYFKDNVGATSVTGKYSVVINYTGDTINKTVKIDRTAPTTATLKFTDSTQKGINIKEDELKTGAVAKFASYLTSKDSYGVDATIAPDGKTSKPTAFSEEAPGENIVYTVSDIDSEKGTVEKNGTNVVEFINFVAGDSFTLTCTVGTATFSTVVSVQAGAATTPETPVSAASGTYSIDKTGGKAAVDAVPGVFKLKITANFSDTDSITVAGTTLTNGSTLTAGADVAATIGVIVTELKKVTDITDVYEVTSEASTGASGSIDTLVITQKTASKSSNILTADTLKVTKAASGTVTSESADCAVAGDITEAAAAVPEEYTFTLTKLFVAGDTITIDGKTLTAVESGAGASQFEVGTTLNAQATNIATALSGSTTSFNVVDGGSEAATFTLTQQTYAADNAPEITTGVTAE